MKEIRHYDAVFKENAVQLSYRREPDRADLSQKR
ncbi:hypothetical protein EV145_104265 [Flavobacterium sp. 245]|nr:hypothetical protein EV145_104265 [Flavobacterium sp. 245]